MDGLLVIDKPAGPTSHDVVARLRRTLREPRIGHTGTLDPSASGVLPLVIGRATRLAQFMSSEGKAYDAVVRLGFSTDTADAAGQAIGPVHTGPWPDRDAIDRALDAFRGTFVQQPPAVSAKKIGGERSYRLARAARAVRLKPDATSPDTTSNVPGVPLQPDSTADVRGVRLQADPALPRPVTVTAHAIDLVSADGPTVHLHVDCSTGFYVRSLAHDLGAGLGTGGHLASLRRTRSGEFTLADAISLEEAERDPAATAGRVLPPAVLLTHLGAVVLTPDGLRHATHGRELGPASCVSGIPHPPATARVDRDPEGLADRSTGNLVRLVSTKGELIGIARPGSAPDSLHPFVVLV